MSAPPVNAKAVLTAAMSKIGAQMKPRGFKRKGLKLVRASESVVSMIQLQGSQSSTAAAATFVINYGVIVPSLFSGNDLTNPHESDCHWRRRVEGADGHEAWWSVRADDDAEQLATRVVESLERDVLPALDAMQREEDLVALWLTGRSPGLVDAQRLLFLAILLHRAGRRDEFEQIKAELARDETPFGLRASRKLAELSEGR